MSGIFDQIINYSPPLIVSGTVNYKGTWNASTNNPPLSNPPVASTKGDYYVVSTAGTQFSISFAVGDWIISSGTAWEKVDLTDAVSSVFGRTGAVVGVSTDYSAVGLTNTAIGASSPSTGAFTTVTASSTIAATGAVTGSNLSGTNTGDQTTISGNAGSATILQTARNINGVSFNGSADITVAAAAGTLTGNTLASGVTASSLTSVGTIASLVATTADINGGTIDGTTVGATTPSTVAGTTGTFSSGFITNNANSATELTITNTNTGVSARTRLSFVTDLGASAFISYRRAIGDFIIGSDLNIPVSVFSNAAAVGTFSSTGLAVTGALSATGNATVGNNALAGTRSLTVLNNETASGAWSALSVANSVRAVNLAYLSTGWAGAFLTGGPTAESAALYTGGNFPISIGISNAEVARFSSTGLAVTGALSATGALAIGNTVNTVSPTSPNRTVTIVIGGTTYYLAAKTTND